MIMPVVKVCGQSAKKNFYGRYETTQMTVEQLKTLIWRYFISYWNNWRIFSAHGGLPPMAKRQQYYDSLYEAA